MRPIGLRSALFVSALFGMTTGTPLTTAYAFTTPFTFHCTGNACRAVTFLDEGSGCIVATNHSTRPVHITLSGGEITGDILPGETYSKLSIHGCYGYYDGGETANFITGSQR